MQSVELYVGFVGSREYPALDRVRAAVRSLAAKYPDAIVVSGGAKGVDLAAEGQALDCGLRVVSFRPREFDGAWGIQRVEWGGGLVIRARHSPERSWPIASDRSRGYGAPAFFRNGLIASLADQLMAYPCVQSNGHLGGTGDTIRKALAHGVPVHDYPLPNPKK